MSVQKYNRNDIAPLVRVKGDLDAIGGTLVDINNKAIDITGQTITFRMVDAQGVVKVDNQPAVIEDAAAGRVSYTPQAADVDTTGDFTMFFLANGVRYPYDAAQWTLRITEETQAVA